MADIDMDDLKSRADRIREFCDLFLKGYKAGRNLQSGFGNPNDPLSDVGLAWEYGRHKGLEKSPHRCQRRNH